MSWGGKGGTMNGLETDSDMGEQNSWFQELPHYFKKKYVTFPLRFLYYAILVPNLQ